jgi:NAD(P)-dependent dehydrogenase (short-subunit alcohol dehydrogenase family)
MTVTVQLLAPYVLTERLLPVLGEAPGRVITVTSGGLYTQPFDLEKLADAVSGPYNGATVYARVKRAQTVLTHAWQQWHHGTGVRFHTMHPGWVDTPGLAAGLPDFYRFMKPLLRTPAEGADTVAWLCEEPAHGPEGGRLWLDRRPRSEYHAPWTWVAPERRLEQQAAVVRWCQDQTEAFVPVVHDW